MAATYNVAGACLVRTGTGSAAALEDLGYSIDGITIDEQVLQGDVPTDLNGGTEGPPGDIQHFGHIHVVTMALSKYDPAVWAKVISAVRGETGGTQSVAAGTLLFSGSYYYRLLLTASGFTRNYLAAIPRLQKSVNAGSKFSTATLSWQCHAISGVIWNGTTSG